jgi:hypothetical protein
MSKSRKSCPCRAEGKDKAGSANANAIEPRRSPIDELIHWFERADLVLDATLADTLTREELGFAPEVEAAEADDE